jgi:hypothetical protein
MKPVILSIISLFFITFVSAQKKETVKVWGNCGMCEKTIENAAKSAGASEADWNTETKVLTVAYKAKKTDLGKIEQAIAAAGYDTQNYTAPEESYLKLHSCCQYDRKASTSSDKNMDCCADDKGVKGDKGAKGEKCAKNAECANCEKCKTGNCADCCKDGKCTTGKDCCKKA